MKNLNGVFAVKPKPFKVYPSQPSPVHVIVSATPDVYNRRYRSTGLLSNRPRVVITLEILKRPSYFDVQKDMFMR